MSWQGEQDRAEERWRYNQGSKTMRKKIRAARRKRRRNPIVQFGYNTAKG